MNKIICPYCNREYLPGEIFIPKYFLGQPKDIERDIYGKIIWAEGLEQNLSEKFICEQCKKPLNITATIDYKVDIDSKYDFSDDYSSVLYSDRIHLKED